MIIQDLLQLLDAAGFFGDLQEQERVTGLGMKRESMLTLKIQGPNIGVATKVHYHVICKVNRMLSLMNLEVVSTFPICSDGSTGTRFVWKLKGRLNRLWLLQSGFVQT